MTKQEYDLETHPWPPFIPKEAKLLIMGTFPPGPHRWSMDFYYPNRNNDFWKIFGECFFNDASALIIEGTKDYNLPKIKKILNEKGIALNDTGHVVRRLKGNASDKFLEIVEPVNLAALLERMPDCKAIATTGEKAAGVIAGLTGTQIPKIGDFEIMANGIKVWRMPSTSRAYPLKMSVKAEYYRKLFEDTGIL
ncbi:MAG: uracil-DNA glycosylase family protein [Muribaculaceae bacterium]|nr:uracil-DNA glycosylase family protein [Muribaculaceae bacterium]